MKSKANPKDRTLESAVEFLASPSGRRALRESARRSEAAAEPLRKTREVTLSNLHRRFTV
jgi:hypothetical protein